MPGEQAGVAAAIATTSRQFRQAIGVAIVGAIVASGAGEATMAAASHPAWWTLAGLGSVVFVLGALATGSRAKRSAHHVALALNPDPAAA
jgi:hypothetical protein